MIKCTRLTQSWYTEYCSKTETKHFLLKLCGFAVTCSPSEMQQARQLVQRIIWQHWSGDCILPAGRVSSGAQHWPHFSIPCWLTKNNQNPLARTGSPVSMLPCSLASVVPNFSSPWTTEANTGAVSPLSYLLLVVCRSEVPKHVSGPRGDSLTDKCQGVCGYNGDWPARLPFKWIFGAQSLICPLSFTT